MPRLELAEIEAGDGKPERALKPERRLYHLDEAEFLTAAVYDRARLLAGDRLTGPAIVEQFDSTTIILAGQDAEIDRYGNLIIAT